LPILIILFTTVNLLEARYV